MLNFSLLFQENKRTEPIGWRALRDMENDHWQQEIDAAHRIIREANIAALQQCNEKGYGCVAAYQALMQECMENYARLLGSDREAIWHIRDFLDQWEAELVTPDSH